MVIDEIEGEKQLVLREAEGYSGIRALYLTTTHSAHFPPLYMQSYGVSSIFVNQDDCGPNRTRVATNNYSHAPQLL